MTRPTPKKVSFHLPDGRLVEIETGRLATQAHGSVVVKVGNTMLFCSVVSSTDSNEDAPYFPLFVDYQEKFAAMGRIPGNFFRREAKLSDYEVLICRLVDRAIRPLFPDHYKNETQVLINLISGEENVSPDAYAALAASAAFAVSDIPFGGPISEVRVAKIDGEYLINPNDSEIERAELEIIVAASLDNVMMVEGEAKECDEQDLIEAIKVGHEAIKVQCQAQLELAELVGEKATIKREVPEPAENEEVKELVASFAKDQIYDVAKGFLAKHDRKEKFAAIKEALVEKLTEENDEEYMEENGKFIDKYFDKLKKKVIRNMVLEENVRLDGRKLDEVRQIWTEIDYLPSAHGSAIFTRGETQSLTSLTLGSKLDQQMNDRAHHLTYNNFLLHYNFPAYSVGEIKPMRGPGRREVGHANLAQRSLKQVLPDDVGYTIRLVSDIMESNGSSSMATVCAGSLALMDGGINITAPVSGIAMGLIGEDGKFAVLSDILGDEDALGDMDFKVTGTEKGITACQMDIKIDGLPYDLLEKALLQAKEGRHHILKEMAKTIESPREDLKPHAPRVVELIIDKDYIGAVIGPGGKVIQELQAKTGTTITIEEVDKKGIVQIVANNKEAIDSAVAAINDITFEPEVGGVYDGKVEAILAFGVIVKFRGKTGLLHISEFDHKRIEKVEDVFKEGDPVTIKIIGVDKRNGKLKLSRKALIPRPERKPRNEDRSES